MSRSGYTEDWDDYNIMNLYRATVARTIGGKRGQKFLTELAVAMDAMPEKILITEKLVDEEGSACTIGVYCQHKNIQIEKIDYEDPESVGNAVGISRSMAAEIEYENDEGGRYETPEQRWVRMRSWVTTNLKKEIL